MFLPTVLVSHHFMSRAELESPLGAERVAHCVFHVPIGDRLVSMCEVNALGARERYYAEVDAGVSDHGRSRRRGGSGGGAASGPARTRLQ